MLNKKASVRYFTIYFIILRTFFLLLYSVIFSFIKLSFIHFNIYEKVYFNDGYTSEMPITAPNDNWNAEFSITYGLSYIKMIAANDSDVIIS